MAFNGTNKGGGAPSTGPWIFFGVYGAAALALVCAFLRYSKTDERQSPGKKSFCAKAFCRKKVQNPPPNEPGPEVREF